ncbi:hypothetical protein [Peptostreptococcus equinus]|uniref:Uncharacterized protein n=1 Tax=Peptostreptococcus equinus TaxID=3003601 RepID=A0ABY7JMG2_9FIRM|nr:hypothetical protein [Peptostreptococcus sp. CBA3647]WAW14546.1 hypothetical protein O0R46_08065 [Peptostreptococcus sp. CBA3647]
MACSENSDLNTEPNNAQQSVKMNPIVASKKENPSKIGVLP